MNFGFSEEQEMLRDQVRRFMAEDCTLQDVRRITAEGGEFPAALWQQVAGLGWLALNIPEAHSGLGLKWVDVTVVLEETARGLSPLPLASQFLANTAVARLGNDTQRAAWLPAMASGEAKCTIALHDDPSWIHPDAITLSATPVSGGYTLNGSKGFVSDAASADYLLLAVRVDGGGLGLAAVPASDAQITPLPHMDRTKPAARVTLTNYHLDAGQFLPMTTEDLTFLTDCGAVAVTAEMVGAADQALAITAGYARERIQFGKPIGQYQGVKHRLAEMYVDIESFRSLLYYAAWAVDDAPAELSRAASLAKGYASDAFAQIGIDGVGLHGAIGFTAEYDIQLYLKRSKWARPAYGDSDFHLERVATLGGV